MTLDQLPIGKEARILTVGGQGALRRRLLDMELTLRLDDAKKIEIEEEPV